MKIKCGLQFNNKICILVLFESAKAVDFGIWGWLYKGVPILKGESPNGKSKSLLNM